MSKLFCDCKTDEEKSNFFLSGRGVETGVIAPAISNEVAMAFHRCFEFKKQLDAALEACKAKDEALEGLIDTMDLRLDDDDLSLETRTAFETLAIQPDDSALKDKAMTTYEQPKDWIERHLVEDPGGLLACEPSGLNEELKLARQANEFQHQTIKKQAAQIATMRELLLLSKNGSNTAYQEAVQKALAIQPDDSALKAWLGDPVAWLRDDDKGGSINTMSDCCTDVVKQLWRRANPKQVERYTIPLYAPKGLQK
ncbi:MAG: hypothetical protein IPG22_06575 [Acidobacteria bacterium]|nr:hypothetical protein [Acidobacteriota bacterium]